MRLDVLCAYVCANLRSVDSNVHLFQPIMAAFGGRNPADDVTTTSTPTDAVGIAVTLRSFLGHFLDQTYDAAYVLHLERAQRKTGSSERARRLVATLPRRKLFELLLAAAPPSRAGKTKNKAAAGAEMLTAFRVWARALTLTPAQISSMSTTVTTLSSAAPSSSSSFSSSSPVSPSPPSSSAALPAFQPAASAAGLPRRLFEPLEICVRLSRMLSADGSSMSVLRPSEYETVTRREVEADRALTLTAAAAGHSDLDLLGIDVASCRRRAMDLLCLPLCAALSSADSLGHGANSSTMRAPRSTADATATLEPGLFSRLFSRSEASSSATSPRGSQFNAVANESVRGAVCALLLSEPGFAAIAPNQLVRCLCCASASSTTAANVDAAADHMQTNGEGEEDDAVSSSPSPTAAICSSSSSDSTARASERALLTRGLHAWCQVLEYVSRLALSGSNDANIDAGARAELFWWSPEREASNQANVAHARKQRQVHDQIAALTAPRVRRDGASGTLVGCSAALALASNVVCLEERRRRLVRRSVFAERNGGRSSSNTTRKRDRNSRRIGVGIGGGGGGGDDDDNDDNDNNDDNSHNSSTSARGGGETKQQLKSTRPNGATTFPAPIFANDAVSFHCLCSALATLVPFLPEGTLLDRGGAGGADDASMTVWLREGARHTAVAVPALVGVLLRQGLACGKSAGEGEFLVGRMCDAMLPREGPDRSSVGVMGLDPSLGGKSGGGAGGRDGGGSGFWGAVSSWGKRLLGGGGGDSTSGVQAKKTTKKKQKKKVKKRAVENPRTDSTETESTLEKQTSGGFFSMFRRSSWKRSRTDSSQPSSSISASSVDVRMVGSVADRSASSTSSDADEDAHSDLDESSSNAVAHSPVAGHAYSPAGALALCALLSRLFWLWPEGTRATPAFSTTSTSLASRSLLSFLSYTESLAFVPRLWRFLELDFGGRSVCGYASLDAFAASAPADSALTACDGRGVSGAVCVFSLCFSNLLTVLDESELYDAQTPLPRRAVVRLVETFKVLLFRLHWELDTKVFAGAQTRGKDGAARSAATSSSSSSSSSLAGAHRTPFAVCLRAALTGVLRLLFKRSSRRPLAYPADPDRHAALWLVPQLRSELGTGNHLVGLLMQGSAATAEEHQDSSSSSSSSSSQHSRSYLERIRRDKSLRAHAILRAMPWCIPFKDRLLLFQHIIRQQRDRDQDGGDVNSAVRVRVRRSQIFDDALRRLNPLGTDLRKRIYVVFVNPLTGEDETGIDAGGLFKELWTTLSGVAFDPNYGLWDVTPQTHLMYPSANAHLVHGRDNQLVLYEFLGRVLGKAMFEGIVVQPNFAHFFLTKLLGKFSSLSDLASLDEELFRNLMFLKTYEGDARDLMLNFVVTEETLGVTREIELCRGGAEMEVTSRNKLRYVYHVANYRLNTKIRPQCAAFLKGLRDLIPVDWLRMFSERELQWLISGSDAAIDVDDLRAHTNYTGGYTSLSGGVRKFWAVVGAFSKEERSQLLRFVTSCERAPPLGFKALHPPFNVQWVGGAPQKLPSASTCFNTLKLPSYSSEKQLREKLLQSIQSGAGFDLS